ncbi:hypothetical protein L596_006791 [Steinernema carpocapsae]|uniref:SXP/RAL-2 family protein Ani s 5-like cation-binding domain-containing protein n=1 Tax=Steinernema carpocapsae TaxID=34508 RepID=A0A4U5P891_STECR|nr:hypothetical protein L596_006791 [Steinernema carpocapsae]
MRSFLLLSALFVAFAYSQAPGTAEQGAHQAISGSTEEQFSKLSNLMNTADPKFQPLITQVMANYNTAHVIGNEHVWNTMKPIVDMSGLSDADKEQFYNLMSQELQNQNPNQSQNA